MDGVRADNIGELQIWMEGQFSLVKQAQANTSEDLKQVRSRVHDLGNDVARLLAMDIAGKIKQLEDADKEHESNYQQFAKDMAERRGVVLTLKALWAVVGLAVGTIITLIIEGHGIH